jgi:hypothetical protein
MPLPMPFPMPWRIGIPGRGFPLTRGDRSMHLSLTWCW